MAALPQIVSLLPAGLALALMPGPNNLLSVQVAAADGVAAACRAGLGRLVAFALLLVAAALGVAAVLRHAPVVLTVVQTAASAYLLAIAARLWREAAAPPPDGAAEAAEVPRATRAWRREFLIALGNPKCLLIATAFVPQCVDPARPAAPQLLAVSVLVLTLEGLAVGAYAAAGRSLLRWLPTPAHWRRFGRACAVAMAAAALWLLARSWSG